MTRLLLLRHAESEWNAQGRWQGQADPALSERGRSDAAAAAQVLRGEVRRVVASDLERASATARIIAEVLGLGEVDLEPALREIDVGEWSGLTNQEIEERWPGAVERWRRGEAVPGGGEDRSDFLERLMEGVRAVASSGEGPVLVVTHGAAIGVIERHLGVHPGTPVPKLGGHWFSFEHELHADGERISLLDGSG